MTELPELDLPEGLTIEKVLEKLNYAPNQIYFCDALHAGNPVRIYLKLYAKGKTHSANEGPIMEALSDWELGVPRIFGWRSSDPAYLAVAAIDGSPAPSFLKDIEEERREAASNQFVRQIGECLGRIHQVKLDWTPAPEAGGGVHHFLSDESLKEKRDRDVWQREPRFEKLFDFLKATVPERREMVLTHGDHNYLNVLFKYGQFAGVIDWEAGGSVGENSTLPGPLWGERVSISSERGPIERVGSPGIASIPPTMRPSCCGMRFGTIFISPIGMGRLTASTETNTFQLV